MILLRQPGSKSLWKLQNWRQAGLLHQAVGSCCWSRLGKEENPWRRMQMGSKS